MYVVLVKWVSEFASLTEAAGSQHPHLKVCCLPEASSV